MNDQRNMRGGDRRRATSAALAMLVLCGVWLAGCSGGVRWVGPTYADAHTQAKAKGQLTFVYFRNWYMPECTEFEERVLRNPEVLAESAEMVCVPLNFDWDRTLAQQWGITTPPGVVIVAPDGTVFVTDDAPITLAELLAEIRGAKSRLAGAATSSPAPP